MPTMFGLPPLKIFLDPPMYTYKLNSSYGGLVTAFIVIPCVNILLSDIIVGLVTHCYQ